jgi:formylglycine-generating enzyme required for sulfatase activity
MKNTQINLNTMLTRVNNFGVAHGVTRPTWALFLCLLWLATTFTAYAAPWVTNVTTLVSGTNVTIKYAISDASFNSANVYVLVSPDSGNTWAVPATNFSGTYGQGVAVSSTLTTNTVVWNAGTDWPGTNDTHCRVRVVACDNGMVMIPAGSYLRGNPPALGDSDITDAPQYSVFINPFLMDSNLVTYSQWQTVYNWAITNGYSFDNPGWGKSPNHPVVNINWYDAEKWCNARSEMEGVTPAIILSGSTTTPPTNYIRTGHGPDYDYGLCMWGTNGSPNGYRLPTEAEWEKAARGGLNGQRFPWGYKDTIDVTNANYHPYSPLTYDTAGYTGYNQLWYYLNQPFTSPVGSCAPNGYGLFDMAGNVNEWCWDSYSSTSYQPGQTNPSTGAATSSGGRIGSSYDSGVIRGGSWYDAADKARCANRGQLVFTNALNTVGFRCVRGF